MFDNCREFGNMERPEEIYLNEPISLNVIRNDGCHKQYANRDKATVKGARKIYTNIQCNEKISCFT